jgi:hypothetical protein
MQPPVQMHAHHAGPPTRRDRPIPTCTPRLLLQGLRALDATQGVPRPWEETP